MVDSVLQYAMSWAFSILLGSFGVFFVYLSFLKPDIGADAIVLLGAASALAWARDPAASLSSKGRIRRRL
jgi:hypothetical protein